MKKCIILIALLVLALAPVKAQSSKVYFSSYCDRTLKADSSTWSEWSEWVSTDGELANYDEYFLLAYDDVEYDIEIRDEFEGEVDEEGYSHQVFNCIDKEGDCQVDFTIDPVSNKTVQCQIWHDKTARAFDVSGEYQTKRIIKN